MSPTPNPYVTEAQRAIERYVKSEYWRLRVDGRFAFTRAPLTRLTRRPRPPRVPQALHDPLDPRTSPGTPGRPERG